MIYFVGAGPGAADLITVRGMKTLEKADIIIYAGSLVNPQLLDYAGPGCRIYDSALMNLEEIIEVMKEGDEAGLNVVRLHTGDPSLYGAIKEQMCELDKLGISYSLCPGVSAYQGAAASLNLEYTLPGKSQTLILTRMEGRTKVPEKERLSDLAAVGATMVLYLSSSLMKEASAQLLEGGYSEDTPVAVVYRATWDDERIIRTNVARVADDMEREGITKHAVVIIGDVLEGDFDYSRLYDAHFTTEYRKGI